MSLREAVALFGDVADLPPGEREAALQAAPPEVARLVRGMLSADRSSLRFRTGIGGELLARDLASDLPPLPEEIPGFRILGLLGQGGMGRVFAAEQASPRRRVALKFLHPWLASGSRTWLRDEADALGALVHPGIPAVHALGEHANLVFLVMELVEGEGLAAYAARQPVRARVRLVAAVADAVAHAHSQGFLHLDLKPGNVLVTAAGQPKVLDFGLSRGVDHPDPAAGGTPTYMSPEQAGHRRVDVRADVYALGVVLWELIRGAPPPASGPLPPLEGDADLTAIVARATAVDRDQRYPSAEALAADLRRYLEHRPVQARAGGGVYRLGKSLRRTPALWATSIAVALSLVIGTAVSVDRAIQAERAREAAESARVEADAARHDAEAQAARAKATVAFLTEVFVELDPTFTTGQKTLLDASLAAVRRLDEGALADAPHEAAHLRVVIAEALMNEGRDDEAGRQIEAAAALYDKGTLKPDAEYVDALHLRAMLARTQKRMDDADAALSQALSLAESLGDKTRQADLLHTRGVWTYSKGDYPGATKAFEDALALKRALGDALDPSLLTNTLNELGHMRQVAGRVEEAEALFHESLEAAKRQGEQGISQQATAWHWLARTALDAGRAEEALADLDRAVALRDGLGIAAPAANRSGEAQLRAEILLALGRYAESERVLRAYLAVEYPEGAERLDAIMLSELLRRRGDLAGADNVIAHAFRMDEHAREGSGAWAWAYTVRGLWRAERHQPGAVEDMERALTVWEPRFGPKGPQVVRLHEAIALTRTGVVAGARR